MFISDITIVVEAGNGGDGKVSFASFKIGGGPDGGTGGDGGDLFVRGTSDLTYLAQYTSKRNIKAENGIPGGRSKKTGRRGKDKTIEVPIGTTITDLTTGETFEITNTHDQILLCQGGKGGLGSFDLRSPTLTTPRIAEKGTPGQKREVHIELKLIADSGLIGLPNAGKSTLLNILTRAHAKVGNYNFTTTEPNLGVFRKKIIADIPGLIAGASRGKGLGIKFLKHIEKVALLLHCISMETENPLDDYETVWKEMDAFNPHIREKEEIILLTKSDLVDAETLKKRMRELKKIGRKTLAISIQDPKSVEKLKRLLS